MKKVYGSVGSDDDDDAAAGAGDRADEDAPDEEDAPAARWGAAAGSDDGESDGDDDVQIVEPEEPVEAAVAVDPRPDLRPGFSYVIDYDPITWPSISDADRRSIRRALPWPSKHRSCFVCQNLSLCPAAAREASTPTAPSPPFTPAAVITARSRSRRLATPPRTRRCSDPKVKQLGPGKASTPAVYTAVITAIILSDRPF